MSGGLISLFGDVDDFKTAMASEGFVGLLVTTPGQFRARLARVSLHGLHLAAGEEELARIAFVVVPQSSVLISLAFGGKSSPVWRGIQQQEGELVTIAAGERAHARTVGRCHWRTMLVSERQLARYGRALTGLPFSVPPGIARWRPTPSIEKHLRQLHRAAIRMAEARSAMLADAAAAHGFEQQLLHALIDCMGAGAIERETSAEGRHRDILSRLEGMLQIDTRRSISDMRAALGVSERLLRKCCAKHLGMTLNRYIRMRRMQEVHLVLSAGDPKAAVVSEVATRYGFRDPGRFAASYRAIYRELPSATLRRCSTAPVQASGRRSRNLTVI